MLVCCGASSYRTVAAVFRDRPSFNAASQNLRTVDFESVPANVHYTDQIDGVVFQSIAGPAEIITGTNGKMLLARTVGEITRLTVFLPPGTTAVACDQFGLPMNISTSTGETVSMNPSDSSTFVGFVSDQQIDTLTISFDFPEPTPNAIIDNLSFGQRRVGNEPPMPQLMVTNNGRAAALDSVTKESEPVHVISTRNLAADGHTRLTLFIVGLTLTTSDQSFTSVQIEDAQQRVFNLPVESTARAKNPSWVSQVTVRLPDSLAAAGNVNVSVSVRGVTSNKAPLRIE